VRTTFGQLPLSANFVFRGRAFKKMALSLGEDPEWTTDEDAQSAEDNPS
jgi:hypothetical protein